MALTLIVEDGTIVANANSYLSVEDADAILEVDFRLWEVWNSQDEPMKEQLLMMATRWLDENYVFFGRRSNNDDEEPPVEQVLQWPRTGVKDCEGNCIADAVIPLELRKATAYAAVWLFTTDPEEIEQQAGIKRFRNFESEIEWQDGWTGMIQPSFFTRLLQCFGEGPGELGFKPIIRK